jgi:hypothetical protein
MNRFAAATADKSRGVDLMALRLKLFGDGTSPHVSFEWVRRLYTKAGTASVRRWVEMVIGWGYDLVAGRRSRGRVAAYETAEVLVDGAESGAGRRF